MLSPIRSILIRAERMALLEVGCEAVGGTPRLGWRWSDPEMAARSAGSDIGIQLVEVVLGLSLA